MDYRLIIFFFRCEWFIYRFLHYENAQLSQIIPVLLLPFSWPVRGVSKQTPWKSDSTLLNPRPQNVGAVATDLKIESLKLIPSNNTRFLLQELYLREMFGVWLYCSRILYGHGLLLRPALSLPISPIVLLAVSHCGIRSTHRAPWETSSTQLIAGLWWLSSHFW